MYQQMETSVLVLPCLKHTAVVLANCADQLSFNDMVTQEHAALFKASMTLLKSYVSGRYVTTADSLRHSAD